MVRIEGLNDECVIWRFGWRSCHFSLNLAPDQFGPQLMKAIEYGLVIKDE